MGEIKKHVKHCAEIAMMLMISKKAIDTASSGRLRGQFKRLQKAALRELDRMPGLTANDQEAIERVIRDFDKATGWDKRSVNVITHISFFLALMEDSDHPYRDDLYKIMSGIIDYYERAGRHWTLCDAAGVRALEKWEGVTS